MAQSTITNYFANRKRPAADDLKSKNKVMALDSDSIISGYGRAKPCENTSQPSPRIKLEATVVFSNEESSTLKPQVSAPSAVPKSKTPARTARRATKPKDSKQADMKIFLTSKPVSNATLVCEKISSLVSVSCTSSCNELSNTSSIDNVQERCASLDHCVKPCEIKSSDQSATAPDVKCEVPDHTEEVLQSVSTSGPLSESPVKQEATQKGACDSNILSATEKTSSITKKQLEARQLNGNERKESNIEKARRELSLGDIKSKLTRSARLAELKASMTRLDQGREKLKQIEQAKQNLHSSSAPTPQLNQFNSIQLEVPLSPAKSPMKSPLKSPHKSLAGSRSPAFQRYSSLAQPGTPTLPLPFSYRHLAELFRCVESVVSLLLNRKELVTFRKLQAAVQEMSRKTFTMKHLAQIMTVYPEAYSLKQEKVHNFGTPSKTDKYQLVLIPNIKSNSDGESNGGPSMTPSVLLERRRRFFNNLLNIVKIHHQEFLTSLDPPMEVPMGTLTRWHPEFAVDQVPDVASAPLPQPPDMLKCNSAKDVLAKAKQLYSCNARMEKALESVAKSTSNTQVPTVNVQVVDSPSTQNDPPTSPFKSLQVSKALKGIPKALLEKVRAKQAARALEAMTRTSAQDKEALQYGRLPELARILRNVFVTEKKNSLQLDVVLEKVGNSYRSALSPRELDDHIRLLAKAVPGWLQFDRLLKTDYVKLCKKADMNRVMERLLSLASQKQGLST